MLLRTLFTIAFVSMHKVLCGENISKEINLRPYSAIPVPLSLPYRNERSKQCWLRVEDVELTETVAVYCYIAEAFLRYYIHDYNSRKMTEDDVDVSLWSEEPKPQDDILPKLSDSQKDIKDWKLTTILDPITRMRLYVSRLAVCRLIMYSRESTTNYQIDCEKVLFYVNDRMNGSSKICKVPTVFSVTLIAFLVFGLWI